MRRTDCQKEAFDYVNRGWPVIPLHSVKDGKCTCSRGVKCKSPGKHPRIKEWQHKASTDKAVIESWLSKWPDSNIGILTGNRSGLIVLDIDPRNHGELSLEDLINSYGQLPDTIESHTGGGGRHIYFQHPGGDINCKSSFRPGLDIKADGGYIVVPPSKHISGRKYIWELSSDPADVHLAVLPEWLINMVLSSQSGRSPEEIPNKVFEGKRNDTLASRAGQLRRKGATQDEIQQALSIYNKTHCQPPLPNQEVTAIAMSISKYPINSCYSQLEIKRTDAGNAELLAHYYKDKLLYDHDRSKWLIWDGHTWHDDKKRQIVRLANGALIENLRQLSLVGNISVIQDDVKWLANSANHYRIHAMIDLAKCIPTFARNTGDFNQNPWLLGCANGVIDLKTGKLHSGIPCNMISLSTGIVYEQMATAPRWEKFLQEIFVDPVLIAFIQRLAGYSLTGSTKEQIFVVCYGIGSNGKSVLFNALRNCLGDYGANTSFSTFEYSKYSGSKIPNDLAALVGKRMVTASEVQERSRWNEGLIKAVTGEDPIHARFLHKEYFNFTPQFKVWVAVNHKPCVSDTSHAFWRRVLLIPFTQTFKPNQQDKLLSDKLRQESPGILAWMVKGCLKWQNEGRQLPDTVQKATTEYRKEEDVIQLFLNENTIKQQTSMVKYSELYDAYRRWCMENGFNTGSSNLLGRRLTEMGIRKGISGPSRTRHYYGIGLKDDSRSEREE